MTEATGSHALPAEPAPVGTPIYDQLVKDSTDPSAPLPPRPPIGQTIPGPDGDPVVGRP